MARLDLAVFMDVLVADRVISELMRLALEGSGLSALEYAIYSLVAEAPEITATTLAAHLGAPLTTVADWLAAPVRRGHVVRRRLPSDGRAWGLCLTAEGAAAHERARVAFAVVYDRYLQQPGVDVAAQRAALDGMIRAVREVTRELETRDAAR